MARTRKTRIGQADLDAAKAEGIAFGRNEGATAEHERLVAILALPEAVNRQESAFALALAGPPSLSVEQVQRVLRTVPEDATPVEPTAQASLENPFLAAMERGNPEVGACNVIDGPWRGPTAQSSAGEG